MSAAMSIATQRTGTRKAGTISQSTRDGIQISCPNTVTGLGNARRREASATPTRPAVAMRPREASARHVRHAMTIHAKARTSVSSPA